MKMSRRIPLFLLGAFGAAFLYVSAASQLAPIGHYAGPYGDQVNQKALKERYVTDSVSAVNFDIRAFDTLGEEFILFASVLGAVVLLREAAEKKNSDHESESSNRDPVPAPSDAVRVWTLGMTGPTVLFGIYIVTHGQLSPGGGFQGGVILATAPLLIYLAQDYEKFKRIAEQSWVEVGEAVGAAGYVVMGCLALFWDQPFLGNFLPYAEKGSILSGGTMPLISLLTGLEVAGGFTLLLTAFLQKVLAEKS